MNYIQSYNSSTNISHNFLVLQRSVSKTKRVTTSPNPPKPCQEHSGVNGDEVDNKKGDLECEQLATLTATDHPNKHLKPSCTYHGYEHTGATQKAVPHPTNFDTKGNITLSCLDFEPNFQIRTYLAYKFPQIKLYSSPPHEKKKKKIPFKYLWVNS